MRANERLCYRKAGKFRKNDVKIESWHCRQATKNSVTPLKCENCLSRAAALITANIIRE